tara:strand:- start:442 stop:948 length:507 start_codon:yes stop_codon:yes gene_type:complete
MYFLRLILIFFLFQNYALSNENLNLVIIDLDYVFKNSNAGKKISKNSINKKEALIKEKNKIEAKLEKQKNDIMSKRNVLDKKDFEEKVISHQNQVKEHQIKINQDLKKVNDKFIKDNIELKKEIDKLLIEYSKENSIDLIVNKNSIVVSNTKIDMTMQILEIINNKIK